MARIRTIKPEIVQSETLGGVSREARYCFVLLWTQADDAGRLRGSSRMLASLLYPYDDDAKTLIEGWLGELEQIGCIRRYIVDDAHYVDIPKWLEHQKIDHPTASKLPPFPEPSRKIAKRREPSLRTKDQDLNQGPRTEEGIKEGTTRSRGSRLSPDWLPSDDLLAWAKSERPELDVHGQIERFRDYWHARAGPGGVKLDWTKTFRNWIRDAHGPRQPAFANGQDRAEDAARRRHAAVERGLEIGSPLRTDG